MERVKESSVPAWTRMASGIGFTSLDDAARG